jgi:hypothetical protein
MLLTARSDSGEVSNHLDRQFALYFAALRFGKPLPRGVWTGQADYRAKFTKPSGLAQDSYNDIRKFP